MKDCWSCSLTESIFPLAFLFRLLLSCSWSSNTSLMTLWPSKSSGPVVAINVGSHSSLMGEYYKFTSGCSLYSPLLGFIPVHGIKWTNWDANCSPSLRPRWPTRMPPGLRYFCYLSSGHLAWPSSKWIGITLGPGDALEEKMATHSSILAWEIPWTGEPGGLQSMGSQRVGRNWAIEVDHHSPLSSLFIL